MARTRRTLSFSEIAAKTLRKVDPDGRRHGARAVVAWHEVVGPEIDRHTKGFALRPRGELVVYVDSGAWATQLSIMSGELLERISEHLGEDLVRSLRFTVSREVHSGIERPAHDETEPGYRAAEETKQRTLDSTEMALARDMARQIPDERLREAALRVMFKDMESKQEAESLRRREGNQG